MSPVTNTTVGASNQANIVTGIAGFRKKTKIHPTTQDSNFIFFVRLLLAIWVFGGMGNS